jgi:hypothetical protein
LIRATTDEAFSMPTPDHRDYVDPVESKDHRRAIEEADKKTPLLLWTAFAIMLACGLAFALLGSHPF